MPGGDGTGPLGFGPMTGRRAGYCTGYQVPGSVNNVPFGARGRGFRRASAPGPYIGRGRGGLSRRMWSSTRFASAPTQPYWEPVQAEQPIQSYQITKEQEIQILEDEQKILKQELEEIKKRIEELKKQK